MTAASVASPRIRDGRLSISPEARERIELAGLESHVRRLTGWAEELFDLVGLIHVDFNPEDPDGIVVMRAEAGGGPSAVAEADWQMSLRSADSPAISPFEIVFLAYAR